MPKISFLVFLMGLCTFIGCVKNTDTFTEYHDINDFHAQNIKDISTSTFSTQSEFLLVREGIRLEVPKNSLVDAAGNIYQGTVNLKVKYLDSKGDYIKHGFHTQGVNELLDIKSMLLLEFTASGKRLLPNRNSEKSISVYIPNFFSDFGEIDVYRISDSGWDKSDTKINDWEVVDYTSQINGDQQIINGVKFSPIYSEWIAIGSQLSSSGTSISVCAQLPENHNDINTVVYCTLDKNRSVVRLGFDNEKSLFCGNLSGVMSTHEMEIIAISNQGVEGKFNFGTKSATISSNETQKLFTSPITRLELEMVLEEL